MARYIDADALTAEFKRLSLGENSLIERIFADGVYAVIDTFPTAEVAPKSKVVELKAELEVWKQSRFNIFQRIELYRMTRTKVAMEIFAEIERLSLSTVDDWGNDIRIISDKDYSELKKGIHGGCK